MWLGPNCPLRHGTRELQSTQLGNDRGGRGQPALGNAGHPAGVSSLCQYQLPNPIHGPHLNPYPTPNMASACSPMRSRFMLAAVGSKRGRRAQVGDMCRKDGEHRGEGAGRHPNHPLLHRAGWQPSACPFLGWRRNQPGQGPGQPHCPAGASRGLGWGSWSGSAPDQLRP